jgi:DNA-binding transcriptional LysR family regulator
MAHGRAMDLLAQMATFVRIVDGQSLSAAARRLRLSLPAVSRQLTALETELGTPLVVRSTRRLHVTEAGQRYYAHCLRVLREIEDVKDDLRGDGRVRGTLVVSASLTYGSLVIAPKLPALVDRHPGLAIELRLEDQLVDLVGESIDVAIRAGTPAPDRTDVVAHPIATMDRILVASPRLLRRHPSPRGPADVEAMPKVVQVTPAGALVPWVLVRDAETVTLSVRDGRLRSNAPVTLRDLAVGAAGVAYLPTWLVADDLAAGRLKRVLPAWASRPLPAFALFRTELRGAPRLRAFLEVLS